MNRADGFGGRASGYAGRIAQNNLAIRGCDTLALAFVDRASIVIHAMGLRPLFYELLPRGEDDE